MTPSLPEPEQWMDKALCAQTDPEAFFPEQGGSSREAKRVCHGCEVRVECLQYALDNGERFGIFGGYSERERRRIMRGEKVPLWQPPPPKRRQGENIRRPKVCAHCGAEFEGHHHQKYCDPVCRRRAEQARYNEARRKKAA